MYSLETPMTVNFELTEHCNANCLFCSIKQDGPEKFADIHTMFHIVDILDKAGVLRLNLFGGEPFIYPHVVELAHYAKDKGFFVSGVSNGLALSQSLCEALAPYVDVIGISVHGLEDSHNSLMRVPNSFRHAMNAIDNLRHCGIAVGINMTITALNYKQIKPLIHYVQSEHKISFLSLNRYIPNRDLDEKTNRQMAPSPEQIESTLYDLRDLSNEYKDTVFKYAIHFPFCIIKNHDLYPYIGEGCKFGSAYCAVDYKGNVKPCSYTNTVLGNIFETPFKEIWNCEFYQSYRSEEWLPDKCHHCEEKCFCYCGCKVSGGKCFGPDIDFPV